MLLAVQIMTQALANPGVPDVPWGTGRTPDVPLTPGQGYVPLGGMGMGWVVDTRGFTPVHPYMRHSIDNWTLCLQRTVMILTSTCTISTKVNLEWVSECHTSQNSTRQL